METRLNDEQEATVHQLPVFRDVKLVAYI